MRSPFKVLSEMFTGRFEKSQILTRFVTWLDVFKTPTVDESKNNYFLARAVYKGRIIKDDDGVEYGSEFQLACAFAKAIVSAPIVMILANKPQVKTDIESDDNSDFSASIAKHFEENLSEISEVLKYGQAEGDSYVFIKDTFDADLVRLRPENVERIVNADDHTETIGFDVTSVKREIVDSKITYVKYKIIYRRFSPFVVKLKLPDSGNVVTVVNVDGKETSIIAVSEGAYLEAINTNDDFKDFFSNDGEERPLPIVDFHNSKEAQSVNGESVFSNLYIYFANYHAVLENSIQNVIFNGNAIPYIKGVSNVEDFLSKNGVYDTISKKYKLKLEPKQLLFGGADFDIKSFQVQDTMGSAEKLLNILFYLILQASEHPEFFFGTAVSSSKASVEDQVPIIIGKANNIQNMYRSSMKTLFETVAYYKARNGDITARFTGSFNLLWDDIKQDNVELMIKLVEALVSQNLITRKTASLILGLSKYVTDIDQELSDADSEVTEDRQRVDSSLFGSAASNADVPDDIDTPDEPNIEDE